MSKLCADCAEYTEGGCPDCKPPVTAPTPDAVVQAREHLRGAFERLTESLECDGLVDVHMMRVDALIAAVRAECAAKVRALPTRYEGEWESRPIPASAFRVDVLKILEAHP